MTVTGAFNRRQLKFRLFLGVQDPQGVVTLRRGFGAGFTESSAATDRNQYKQPCPSSESYCFLWKSNVSQFVRCIDGNAKSHV
jgi:hypothetical protein